MNTQTIQSVRAGQLGVGLGAKVLGVALGMKLASHANIVVRVVGGNVSLLSHRVQSVNHVVPNCVGTSVLGLGVWSLDNVRFSVILLNHGKLVLGDTESGPKEAFLGNNQVADELGQKSGPDLVTPDLTLLVERLGLKHLLDGRLQTEDTSNPAENTDGVA